MAPVVVTVVLALLIGGAPGGLIVLTAAVQTAPGRRSAPAAVALGLLTLAAVATVLEAPLAVSDIGLDYALDRPVAAAAGRLAGVALLVAVTVAAVTVRASAASQGESDVLRPPRRAARSGPRSPRAAGRPTALPYLVAAAGVVAVGTVRGVAPLSPAETALAGRFAAGLGPSSTGTPPLAAALTAVAPVTPVLAVLVVYALGVVVLMRVVRCLGRGANVGDGATGHGGTSITVAGLTLAVAMTAVRPGLAEALATLLVATGLVWLCPATVTGDRAVGAGLCLGGALLARPESVVAVLFVLAWSLLGRLWWPVSNTSRPARWSRRLGGTAPARISVSHYPPRPPGLGAAPAGSLALVTSGLVIAPWQRWLHAHGALPTAGFATDLATWGAWTGPLAVAVTLVWLAHRSRSPALRRLLPPPIRAERE